MSNPNFLRSHLDNASSHSFNFFTNNYKDFGNDIIEALMYVIFTSTLDKAIWFSTKRPLNNILILPNSMFYLPIAINMGVPGTCIIPLGSRFYVKNGPDGNPTSGRLSITTCSMG